VSKFVGRPRTHKSGFVFGQKEKRNNLWSPFSWRHSDLKFPRRVVCFLLGISPASKFHLHRHLPLKMELIEGSETSAFKPQTPGKYQKENILHKEHGESLKLRNFLFVPTTVQILCLLHTRFLIPLDGQIIKDILPVHFDVCRPLVPPDLTIYVDNFQSSNNIRFTLNFGYIRTLVFYVITCVHLW
jgi:hypothetical protein